MFALPYCLMYTKKHSEMLQLTKQRNSYKPCFIWYFFPQWLSFDGTETLTLLIWLHESMWDFRNVLLVLFIKEKALIPENYQCQKTHKTWTLTFKRPLNLLLRKIPVVDQIIWILFWHRLNKYFNLLSVFFLLYCTDVRVILSAPKMHSSKSTRSYHHLINHTSLISSVSSPVILFSQSYPVCEAVLLWSWPVCWN